MRAKIKLDWDTVELVEETPPPVVQLSPDRRRGRSVAKQLMSGGASKARARGSAHTHTQLCKQIPKGIETLIYGWGLVAAAMASDRDLSRGVEIAAHVIRETSLRVARLRADA